jgi:hypothetical protein
MNKGKFVQCLGSLLETTGDKPARAWQYNADLFPHVLDSSMQTLQDIRRTQLKQCENFTSIALPSAFFSRMYHVVHILMTTTDELTIKYDGCYAESYNDPWNPALWKDQALAYSRSLPERKDSQKTMNIYLVDTNGDGQYAASLSQSEDYPGTVGL